MLNIYRFDHVAQVVPDLDPQLKLLEGLFGFRRCRSWEDPEGGCRGVLLDIPGTWGLRWELTAPLGDDSPLKEFLDSSRGPGLHHVGIEVNDFDAAKAELKRLGAEITGGVQEGAGRWLEAVFPVIEGPEGLPFRLYAPPLGEPRGIACSPSDSGKADAPTLGIEGLVHIAQAYRDRDELARWYEDALGMREVYRTPDGKHEDMATMVLTVPGTHMLWELIAPVGEESFVQRYLGKRGAGPHHVTFEVKDWDGALAACEHHGVPTFDLNEGVTDGARWRDIFIHPKHAGGILVQLFWEERPGVWVRSDKVPSHV